ncbi:MAG: hypothetical protein FWF53_12815 [Candidatus Azobacteroides sp.]|nr:hypothetical protein [Candidatus Azobacteroides sp.]
MKTIDSISKDYQIIEKLQQGKIFGGQFTATMKQSYIGRNGDAVWYDDNGEKWAESYW